MNNTSLAKLAQSSIKALAIGSLFASAGAAHGQSFSNVLDGLKEGSKASLNVRARYEYNETPASEINGYSVRTRLALETGEYEGLKLFVEMEDLSFNNDDDRPGLDVPTTELNQVWFSYEGAKVGRQIFVLDDQRFIGHVGWRQNIQTFDAATYSYAIDDKSKLSFAYLDAVHRVNATSQDLAGIVFNGSSKLTENFTLTGYAYLLDFDRPVLSSSDTYGIRGAGKIPSGDISYSYSFSYAKQMDNGGSVRDFDVDYLAGEFGAAFSGMSLTAGVEILDGDGVTGFTTPLATVHKFNGFADAFAGNSLGLGGGLPEGLEDYYLAFGFKAGDVPVKLVYHSFDTAGSSEFLGSEIDLVASYKLNEYVTLIGKFADYSSNGSASVSYGTADKQVLTLEANLAF
ncbi:alginate export family protein [Pelagicoccus sp. SDUM812002]|uniref:alginate export family protein n=1 Tax=Pelagicoccus sp. SDUM812002 TaxID=3041266 RepID=UPI00280C8914|nr:alginate export family protein [Pelagicoccus sp. SDUM812002]MDQ8187152.1 alginate export family protein [Pelagicoccus sp. SDUM812002]